MDIVNFFNDLLSTDTMTLKLVLGSVFGLCLGLTGVGGGVLLIPMLQLFCDMSPVLAVGTASLISSLVKVNASLVHIKARNVSWAQVGWLLVGALPVTLLVTQVVVHFNQHPDYQNVTQTLIVYLVTIVMAGSLTSVCMKYYQLYIVKKPNIVRTEGIDNESTRGRKAVLSGMFCGGILGSTGVGGGVLLLPILNGVLKINIKKSIGSSVVLALLLSAVTAVGFAKGGQSDTITATWIIVGSLFGIIFSSRILRTLSESMTYLITIGVITLSIALHLFGFIS